MKKIIFSILIIIWMLFATSIVLYNLFNEHLTAENSFPSINQLAKEIFFKKQEWVKNICYVNNENKVATNGPYITLIPGDYAVDFYLKGQGTVFADVVAGNGTKVYSSKKITLENNNYSSQTLNFQFDNIPWEKNIEFRVLFIEGNNICIEKVVLNSYNKKIKTFIWQFYSLFLNELKESKEWSR